MVVGIKESHSTKNIILCKSMMFSLMHYTSNVLFGIGKYQIVHAFSISKEAEMPCEEISNHKISHEENHLLPYSQDSPKLEALKCLTFMAENLRKQIQSLLVSVHNTPCNVNVGFGLMKTLIDCPLQLVALVDFCGAYSHLPRTKQMLKIVMKKKKC